MGSESFIITVFTVIEGVCVYIQYGGGLRDVDRGTVAGCLSQVWY